MSNDTDNLNGADAVENKPIDFISEIPDTPRRAKNADLKQEALLHLAAFSNDSDIKSKVLANAAKFYDYYQLFLEALKEGRATSSATYSYWLETKTNTPSDLSAQMSIFTRIYMHAPKVQDAVGLFDYLESLTDKNKKDILIRRFKAGDHSAEVIEQLEQLGVDLERVKGALITQRILNNLYEDDDIGNAQLFADAYSDDIRYVSEWKRWLKWDGKRWSPMTSEKVQLMGQDLVRFVMPMLAGAIKDKDKQAKYYKHIGNSSAMFKVDAMVSMARGRMSIGVNDLDANPMLFNLQNGTLDCRTGEIKPHNRKDYITKISPCSYNASATCPTWDAFLKRIFSENGKVNSEVITYLQTAIGYSLTGSVSEQCMMVLYGSGANGKSTFLETVLYLLGDYGKPIQPSVLLSTKRDGGNGEDIAGLFGVRFASAVETKEAGAFNEEKVKAITGGDTISARRLYENSFTFTPTHKIFLATNHKPNVKGVDNGIWRRLKLIPFTATISDAEKDTMLVQKLRAEADGIFCWCVEGLKRWNAHGLQTPKEVTVATAEYRQESDLFGQFLTATCIIDDTAKVQSKDLYSAYQCWAKDNGIDFTMTAISMAKRLQERGFKNGHNRSGSFWSGIGINDNSPTNDDAAF